MNSYIHGADAQTDGRVFHLVFLRALVAKGEDKSLFALKGGCNLNAWLASR